MYVLTFVSKTLWYFNISCHCKSKQGQTVHKTAIERKIDEERQIEKEIFFDVGKRVIHNECSF